jgi:hypothetical protein
MTSSASAEGILIMATGSGADLLVPTAPVRLWERTWASTSPLPSSCGGGLDSGYQFLTGQRRE